MARKSNGACLASDTEPFFCILLNAAADFNFDRPQFEISQPCLNRLPSIRYVSGQTAVHNMTGDERVRTEGAGLFNAMPGHGDSQPIDIDAFQQRYLKPFRDDLAVRENIPPVRHTDDSRLQSRPGGNLDMRAVAYGVPMPESANWRRP